MAHTSEMIYFRGNHLNMAHQDAKEFLQKAGTLDERDEAINNAISSGMSLHEIEEYLDYLDAIQPTVNKEKQDDIKLVTSQSGVDEKVQPTPDKLLGFSKQKLWIYSALVVSLLTALCLWALAIYRAWIGK